MRPSAMVGGSSATILARPAVQVAEEGVGSDGVLT
jgi:hypothetical protein